MKQQRRAFSKSFLVLLILSFLLSTIPFVSAAENDCIYFFTGKECTSCQDIETLLQELETAYPELRVERFDAYHEEQDALLFRQFLEGHAIPEASQGVPAIFLGKSYLVGKQPIMDFFAQQVREGENSDCPTTVLQDSVGIVGDKEPRHILETITFSVVTTEALRDAFLPAGLALLLFLFGISVLFPPILVVKHGLSLAAGMGVALFLLGFLLLPHLGIGEGFRTIVAVLAVLGGLFQLSSFLRKKKITLSEQLQKRWARFEKILSSPLTLFGIGFLAAFLGTVSSGKIFTLLGEFSRTSFTSAVALPLFVYFLLIFLLPLLLLTVGMQQLWKRLHQTAQQKGTSDMERERWTTHMEKVFKAIQAAALLLVAIIVLLAA
ncbi:MAG: hypothetical protein Q8R53_03505 [Nanoarchaeota archaeon]|nr:hypothetical protein [Nanoarchaeota archaeon]